MALVAAVAMVAILPAINGPREMLPEVRYSRAISNHKPPAAIIGILTSVTPRI